MSDHPIANGPADHARSRPAGAIRIAVAVIAASITSLGGTQRVEACNDSWPFCPCTWEQPVVNVYVNAGNMAATLLPARSQADWVRIVQNVLNIYREQSGLPVRLRYAGTTTELAAIPGAILVRSKSECDGSRNGSASWGAHPIDWNEISNAVIRLHKQRVDETHGHMREHQLEPLASPRGHLSASCPSHQGPDERSGPRVWPRAGLRPSEHGLWPDRSLRHDQFIPDLGTALLQVRQACLPNQLRQPSPGRQVSRSRQRRQLVYRRRLADLGGSQVSATSTRIVATRSRSTGFRLRIAVKPS